MNDSFRKYSVFLIYISLALATFIAFAPALFNDFISFDDYFHVTTNPQVNGGITRSSLSWAFTTTHAGNWQPLTWLSHMLDCELFGLNPMWHHLINLLLHIANTLLLFFVLHRMTGRVWCSAFVAAVFALHPLHVESVAWVSERKDVLSTFFWMLTMIFYVWYAAIPSARRLLIVLLSFCLGLMAKPMMITLPFVLLLLDYWPLGRYRFRKIKNKDSKCSLYHRDSAKTFSTSRLIAEKIPFFIFVLISAVSTFYAQQSGGTVMSLDEASFHIRLANALVTYIQYISKMICPVNLVLLYPHLGKSLPIWQPILCFIMLAGITTCALYSARRRPYFIVGWLWYLGTLVPVIGLVQVGVQAMADRYTYLPSIGIFIIIAFGASEILPRSLTIKRILPVFVPILLLVLLLLTRTQTRYWRNSITLYEHALSKTTNNYLMHFCLGGALVDQNRLDQAVRQYQEALRIAPNLPRLHNHLGLALTLRGQTDLAIKHHRYALKLNPKYTGAYIDLGRALYVKGKYLEAIKQFRLALKLNPNEPNAHNNLGGILLKIHDDTNEAIGHFLKALQQNPNYANAHSNLATAYMMQGKLSEAVNHYQHALRINPNDKMTARQLREAQARLKNSLR